MMEKLGTVSGTVEKMSIVLQDVRDDQINMKYDVKDLHQRVSKIEPLVSSHEDIRKYSRGAFAGIGLVGGAVGGSIASHSKGIAALIFGLFN
jgi:hypothetical protein